MKNVLLIAGGGTLGLYTAKELLRLGHAVDIICLDDMTSDNEKLRFFKANATVEYLKELFKENRYDGIVNFIHYNNYEDYIPYHELLSRNTDHLIFLSSYRVYADLEHPITENAPQLIDVIKDHQAFIEGDNYGLSKSKAERFLADNPYPKNWTVVRPVISFSDKRLDIILTSANRVVEAARTGEVLKLPIEAKNLTAGLDWAGNSGKLSLLHLLGGGLSASRTTYNCHKFSLIHRKRGIVYGYYRILSLSILFYQMFYSQNFHSHPPNPILLQTCI